MYNYVLETCGEYTGYQFFHKKVEALKAFALAQGYTRVLQGAFTEEEGIVRSFGRIFVLKDSFGEWEGTVDTTPKGPILFVKK